MKQVLVTGANGQLGRCIQKIADLYTDINFVFKDSNALDITDAAKVDSTFKSVVFDYCINCAAYTDVEQSEKTPQRAFEVNADGTKNIALACRENNTVLIHISTDYVFDGEKETGYTTEDIPNPINEYGRSKLQGEKYAQEILKNYFIIRTSWLYSEFGKNFYTTILKKANTEKTLYIADGQIGCPTNANNLAEYIVGQIILNELNYGNHHFTDGKAMTWYEFAQKIVKEHIFERSVEVVRDKNYRTFAARPANSILIDTKHYS